MRFENRHKNSQPITTIFLTLHLMTAYAGFDE